MTRLQGTVVEMALRTGTRGPSVVKFQKALQSIGYDTRPDEEGVFGSRTEVALASFQQDRGLPVTGVFDSATQDALRPEPTEMEKARGAMETARVATVQAEVVEQPTTKAEVAVSPSPEAAKTSVWVYLGVAALVVFVLSLGSDEPKPFSEYEDDYGIGPAPEEEEEEEGKEAALKRSKAKA